ncbi:VOC family protein [Phreatobacter aquaticus]|uniref:VOC family protein n=1 Tax=Phreatobacter aquaticus TaxID=2570229 RepID=A0A4D7QTZ5_9HYPH|nr:VOC family protein [Phreatobacter aquaticus]QCK88764.1 VOC family protein [Phreatobacter aquaticus]
MNAGMTRRALLDMAGAASLSMAAIAAAKAEGVETGPRSGLSPVLVAHQTPMRVGQVSLVVRDLDLVSAFYRDAIGLSVIETSPGRTSLGAGGTVLLVLEQRPAAPFERQGTAGLFHTAFLMPTRKDLARWLVHVARNRVRLTGFADHAVSEAVYLDDPEGNGIEVYCDRAPELWRWDGASVTMTTDQLNIDDLVSLTNIQVSDYATAPEGLRIGHMHLRVGDVARGQAFYGAAVGLDTTRQRGGAAFLSSGRYHHHLGINVWQSNGAGLRDPNATGIAWFSLEMKDRADIDAQRARLAAAGAAVTEMAGGFQTADPWGTTVRLVGV